MDCHQKKLGVFNENSPTENIIESPSQLGTQPDFALMDTVLDKNPGLYDIVKKDYLQVRKDNGFGLQDSPSLEQVVRTSFYMNLKKVDYAGLEYAQYDSRCCETF